MRVVALRLLDVSADAAQWIADKVALNYPNAVRCADPFHIITWVGDALDQPS